MFDSIACGYSRQGNSLPGNIQGFDDQINEMEIHICRRDGAALLLTRPKTKRNYPAGRRIFFRSSTCHANRVKVPLAIHEIGDLSQRLPSFGKQTKKGVPDVRQFRPYAHIRSDAGVLQPRCELPGVMDESFDRAGLQ